jgi:tripartite-type tricarboxylate transporter receptor subunit TctC
MRLHIPPFVLGFIISIASPAIAETNYPERSIRLLFGFPAGADAGVRVIAEKLAESLGRSVIVENVTGAAGNIAADRTASAAPDGATVGMLTGANIVIRPLLHRKLPYDPHKELVPVSVAFRFANILAVNNDVPATTVAELVALARAAPGKLSYGHSGLGSATHLSGELLNVRARINIQGVPYRGPAEILTDLMGGRISMTINPPGSTLPLMQEGKVRALAVTSRTRMPLAPDIPTMIESGYPDFETTVWFGLFVPVRTPQPIVDRLSGEMARIMALPDVRKRFFALGWVPVGGTQAEFTALIKAETDYWAQLIKDAGIRPID